MFNETLKEEVTRRIDTQLETLLSEVYADKDIAMGDISPEQTIVWDAIIKDAATLFVELINQNR